MVGRKFILILLILFTLVPTAAAQDQEEDVGFFASILQRIGIGGTEDEVATEEDAEPEPLIDPVFIPPIVAGVALGAAGVLIFLGYQPAPPKRDPFNRRL